MAIRVNSVEISGIYFAKQAMSYAHTASQLVWQAIRSCFGNGRWAKDKCWKSTDGWKNN